MTTAAGNAILEWGVLVLAAGVVVIVVVWRLVAPAKSHDPATPQRRRVADLERQHAKADVTLRRLEGRARRAAIAADEFRAQRPPHDSPKLQRLDRMADDQDEEAKAASRLVETLATALGRARRDLTEVESPPKPAPRHRSNSPSRHKKRKR